MQSPVASLLLWSICCVAEHVMRYSPSKSLTASHADGSQRVGESFRRILDRLRCCVVCGGGPTKAFLVWRCGWYWNEIPRVAHNAQKVNSQKCGRPRAHKTIHGRDERAGNERKRDALQPPQQERGGEREAMHRKPCKQTVSTRQGGRTRLVGFVCTPQTAGGASQADSRGERTGRNHKGASTRAPRARPKFSWQHAP